MARLTAVILAAGKGTRMVSDLAKVLHKVNGRPMLSYVIDAACNAGANDILLVVGHGAKQVKDTYGESCLYCQQMPQLGTGHALQVALPYLPEDSEDIMVICGDTPVISAETLSDFYSFYKKSRVSATVLSAELANPTGYGRIVRGADGNVQRIVEQRDASEQEKQIKEINTGAYCFRLHDVAQVIADLKPNNAQGEYYLTDVIPALAAAGKSVNSQIMTDSKEFFGVNDRLQLAQAAKILRQRKCRQLMLAGVSIIDPKTTYIEDSVKIGPDTVVEPNVIIRGATVIGQSCFIGKDCDITDSVIGAGSSLKKAVLWEAQTGQNCNIGPFAYLRPGTVLSDNVKVGDFVEIKKSQIGTGSKVPHLSYIGDATVGEKVNIGCGTITCNYDGYHKYPTEISDGVFIGSNSNLVAPVKIGKNATVAAGSTITEEVPEESLGIARGRQANKQGWSEKKRKKEQELSNK